MHRKDHIPLHRWRNLDCAVIDCLQYKQILVVLGVKSVQYLVEIKQRTKQTNHIFILCLRLARRKHVEVGLLWLLWGRLRGAQGSRCFVTAIRGVLEGRINVRTKKRMKKTQINSGNQHMTWETEVKGNWEDEEYLRSESDSLSSALAHLILYRGRAPRRCWSLKILLLKPTPNLTHRIYMRVPCKIHVVANTINMYRLYGIHI